MAQLSTYDIDVTELKSQWLGEEVLSNALAAVNNLTYYAAESGPWVQNCEKITTSKLHFKLILYFTHMYVSIYLRTYVLCTVFEYVCTRVCTTYIA